MEPLGVLHYSYCQHCTAENLLHTTVLSHRNAGDKYMYACEKEREKGGGGGRVRKAETVERNGSVSTLKNTYKTAVNTTHLNW